MQDNGKPVKGHASHSRYELAKGCMVLTGENAYLEQRRFSTLPATKSPTVKEQKIRAFSEKGKRVWVSGAVAVAKTKQGRTPAQEVSNSLPAAA